MDIHKEQVLQNKNYIYAYSDDMSMALLFVPLASMRFRFSYVLIHFSYKNRMYMHTLPV